MSIRIHELAKELHMENKELMALLKERKIIPANVKSPSSTVDNISASALRDEFGPKDAGAPAAQTSAPVPSIDTVAAETPGAAPKVTLPAGVFVKSKQDIDREKETAAKAVAASAAAKNTAQAP